MSESVPFWFVIIFVVFLIIYLLRNAIGGVLGDIFSVLRGKMSVMGCLLSFVVTIIIVGIAIWAIFTQLF